MKRLSGAVAALAATLLAGSADAYMKNRGHVPSLGGNGQGGFADSDINVVENLGARVPAGLSFVDGQGKRVALDSYLNRGKPVVITLGYYSCPMLCNLVHEGLAKSVSGSGLKLGKDFLGVAVSFDPKEDPKSASTNQARLLRALGHEGRTDWPFLYETGGLTNVTTLAETVGVRYKYDEKSKQFAHAAVAIVLAPDGKITRYIHGLDFPPRDFRMAIVEAGEGRVGTSIDRALLTCFRYDPMTQRYTPFVFGFVRIGAFACFAALAGVMVVLWRHPTR